MPEQMKSSEVSSIIATHPIELGSLMKHFLPYVQKALADYQNKSKSANKDNNECSTLGPSGTSNLPFTDTDTDTDTDLVLLETPSKRLCYHHLTETLSTSQSGSFLVSSTHLSLYKIPPITLGEKPGRKDIN